MRKASGTRVHDEVVKLVEDSRDYLVLITPWLHLWSELERALARAVLRGVRVQVITRPPSRMQDAEHVQRLEDLEVAIAHSPGMHEKQYLSERAAIHGSANLVRSAVGRSTESVLIFDRDLDPEGWCMVYDLWHQVLDDDARRTSGDHLVTGAPPAQPQANYCVRCKAPAWLRNGGAEDAVDQHVLCLRCRAEAITQGKDWRKLRGTWCTACRKEASVSVSRPRCTACFERDVLGHGRTPQAWHVSGSTNAVRLWTTTALDSGHLLSPDREPRTAVSRRWPTMMTRAGSLVATIVTPDKQKLNPLHVALPEHEDFYDPYDCLVVQRGGSSASVGCPEVPELSRVNHLSYVAGGKDSLPDLWDEPDVLCSWDLRPKDGGPGVDPMKPFLSQAGIPFLRGARKRTDVDPVNLRQVFLRVDLVFQMPEHPMRRRRWLVNEIVEILLASQHSYDEAELAVLMSGVPDPGRSEVIATLTTPGPLGPATFRRDRKGAVVAWPAAWDRIAAFRVRFLEAGPFALKAAISTVRVQKVH